MTAFQSYAITLVLHRVLVGELLNCHLFSQHFYERKSGTKTCMTELKDIKHAHMFYIFQFCHAVNTTHRIIHILLLFSIHKRAHMYNIGEITPLIASLMLGCIIDTGDCTWPLYRHR